MSKLSHAYLFNVLVNYFSPMMMVNDEETLKANRTSGCFSPKFPKDVPSMIRMSSL